MYLSLLSKNVKNELECLVRIEALVTLHELALLDHFHIKNVIHKAYEKIDLGNNDDDCATL